MRSELARMSCLLEGDYGGRSDALSDHREIAVERDPALDRVAAGRRVIAAIGIDHCRHWRPLDNAVSDALSVRALFLQLGFEELTAPLLDDEATRTEILGMTCVANKAVRPDRLDVARAAHSRLTRRHLLRSSGSARDVGFRVGFFEP